MRKLVMMAVLAIGLTAASCCKDDIFGDDTNGGGKDQTCTALTIENASESKIIDCMPANNNIQRAWVDGDFLKIEVAYSGCNQHEFDLLWDGSWLKSNPAQVNLNLFDKTGEQMCEAYFQHTLCYNISSLRTGKHGSVQINLIGYSDGLTYKY